MNDTPSDYNIIVIENRTLTWGRCPLRLIKNDTDSLTTGCSITKNSSRLAFHGCTYLYRCPKRTCALFQPLSSGLCRTQRGWVDPVQIVRMEFPFLHRIPGTRIYNVLFDIDTGNIKGFRRSYAKTPALPYGISINPFLSPISPCRSMMDVLPQYLSSVPEGFTQRDLMLGRWMKNGNGYMIAGSSYMNYMNRMNVKVDPRKMWLAFLQVGVTVDESGTWHVPITLFDPAKRDKPSRPPKVVKDENF